MKGRGVYKLTELCSRKIMRCLFDMTVKTLSESDQVVHYITSQMPQTLYDQLYVDYRIWMRETWGYRRRWIKHTWLRRNAITRCLSLAFKKSDFHRCSYYQEFSEEGVKALNAMIESDMQRFLNIQSM